jgi:GH25 family lysozyme M1 (1,4-beta-N-acetylmuramidase)
MRALVPLQYAGSDISEHQRAIDIAGYAAEYPLVIIKVSEGSTYEDPEYAHFAGETGETPYRGFYHFSTHSDAQAQATNFVSLLRREGYLPLKPGDFLIIDSEKSDGTEVPDAITDAIQADVQIASPEKPVWRYGYRSMCHRWRDNGYAGPLWVASFDVLEDAQALGAVLDQYGIADSLMPFYNGDIDVNRVLDLDAFHALTYPSITPQETQMEITTPLTIKDHDAAGNPTVDYPTNVGNTLVYIHDGVMRTLGKATSAATDTQSLLAEIVSLKNIVNALVTLQTTAPGAPPLVIDYAKLSKAVADELAYRLAPR